MFPFFRVFLTISQGSLLGLKRIFKSKKELQRTK